ncbi:hypothetical protein CHPC966_001096 [Lactococcus phage CHPC966]|uniref:Terminase large subunit-like endonuclease domain-containing protein n=1 Tax=Lactococcus phage CHPC966 TaxID=2675258 RepID=A0A650EV76_9CAUD|nr:hypothetical protein KMC97_gp31 [Lactococcus phage CHPC966]QGT53431.1 hypothetical protein CHPC966_001096 [Lactococcus phage CHPC966]
MTLPNNERFKIIPYHKAVLTLKYCIPYQIDEIVVIVGRSNAKSILDVMIALIELFLFPKPNSVIALMATKKDQAEKILMKHFRAMGNCQGTVINKFKNQFKLNKEQILVKDNSILKSKGTEISIYASNEDTLDGGREQLVIIDEFGAFKKNPLVTIRQGLRKNKGTLFISTTNNVIRVGYTLTLEDIQKDFIGAIGNPVKMAKIITKRFNLSMTDSTTIFTKQIVDKCLVPPLDFEGRLVAIGSDFSVRGDVWGSVIGYRENGHYYFKAIPIMPESAEDKFKHLGETITHEGVNNMSDEAWDAFMSAMNGSVPIALNYDPNYSKNFIDKFEQTYDIEFYNKVMQNSFKLSNTLEATQKLMEEGKIHFDSKLLAVHLMNAETKINDFGLMRIIKKGCYSKAHGGG